MEASLKTRRTFLALVPALAATMLAKPALAQAPGKPFVAYDEELKNGWQNWSWAKVAMSVPAGGSKPIKVEGDAWSALALHHEPFSTEGFTKLTFYINGGVAGGQTLTVRATSDKKTLPSDFFVQPKAKTWAVVEVPLKEIGAQGKTIDGFQLQAQGSAYGAYYVDRIQFE
jgi:hypothetical protein